MKKVSIIVPMYGVEKYIKECLESVANQTYTNIECIVVDDCGPDKSYDNAKDFIDNYSGDILFKIVRHQHNKGLSGARNTGIEYSTGEFIFFLDSDDLISSNTIEVLLANSKDTDFVMANMLIFSDKTGEIIRQPKHTTEDYYYFKNLYEFMTNSEMLKLDSFGLPYNKLFRRSFIDEHKLRFDEGIYFEDDVWSFKVYSQGPRVAFISDVTYKYRVRVGSIMNTYNENHLLSSLKIPSIILKYAKENTFTENWYVEQSIERFIMAALYTCIERADDAALFAKVYNYFTQIHKPSVAFWADSRIKKTTKIEAIHYYLPIIGKYYLKAILYIQKKKLHRILPFRKNLKKLKLSKQFWMELNLVMT